MRCSCSNKTSHSCCPVLLCRLLSRANALHNRLYTEAYGCGRKGGGWQMQRCLDSIQDVQGVLSSYRCAGFAGVVRWFVIGIYLWVQ